MSREIRRLGFDAREIDTMHGAHWDVASPGLLRRLCRAVKSGDVRGLTLAPHPCGSFSVAQDRTGRLRSEEFPWGLTDRSAERRSKVAEGNRVARAIVRLIHVAQRCKIPWVLENPHSSRFWLLPPLRRLSGMNGVETSVVEFCMCGTKWRKRTRFLSGGVEADDLCRLRRLVCQGEQGLCGRTLLPHFRLSGTGPGGRPWTAIAQPYPQKLCRHLAWILTERARHEYADRSYRQLVGNRP